MRQLLLLIILAGLSASCIDDLDELGEINQKEFNGSQMEANKNGLLGKLKEKYHRLTFQDEFSGFNNPSEPNIDEVYNLEMSQCYSQVARCSKSMSFTDKNNIAHDDYPKCSDAEYNGEYFPEKMDKLNKCRWTILSGVNGWQPHEYQKSDERNLLFNYGSTYSPSMVETVNMDFQSSGKPKSYLKLSTGINTNFKNNYEIGFENDKGNWDFGSSYNPFIQGPRNLPCGVSDWANWTPGPSPKEIYGGLWFASRNCPYSLGQIFSGYYNSNDQKGFLFNSGRIEIKAKLQNNNIVESNIYPALWMLPDPLHNPTNHYRFQFLVNENPNIKNEQGDPDYLRGKINITNDFKHLPYRDQDWALEIDILEAKSWESNGKNGFQSAHMWGPKNQHANTTKNAWVDMQQEVIYGAIVELQPDTGKRRIIFYFDDPSDASDGFITSIIEEGSLMEVGKDRKTVRVIIDDVLNYLIMGVGMEQREPSIGEALYIDYVQLYTE